VAAPVFVRELLRLFKRKIFIRRAGPKYRDVRTLVALPNTIVFLHHLHSYLLTWLS